MEFVLFWLIFFLYNWIQSEWNTKGTNIYICLLLNAFTDETLINLESTYEFCVCNEVTRLDSLINLILLVVENEPNLDLIVIY